MNKNIKKLIVGGSLVTVAAISSASIGIQGVSAAGVKINFAAKDDSEQTVALCSIYGDTHEPCDSSYGQYDDAAKVLTLGSGVNGKSAGSYVSIDTTEEMTIKSTDDIVTNLYITNRDKNIVLDFGDYSLTENGESFRDFGNNLTIKSGTYNFYKDLDLGVVSNRSGTLVVDGGTLNFDNNPIIAIQSTKIIINNGNINVPSCDMFTESGDVAGRKVQINGGNIVANNISTSGISNDVQSLPIEINGGNITLKAAAGADAGFGIFNDANKNEDTIYNTIINGGVLTIDGFNWGISGKRNKVIFNGGTTIIKNSKKHTIWITDALDPENDIVFGEGMGIKEDTYVFWDDGELSSTGIADPNIVTIASGYTYRRHKGWEDIHVPETGEKENPDTASGNVMIYVAIAGVVVALGICGKKLLDRR